MIRKETVTMARVGLEIQKAHCKEAVSGNPVTFADE